MAFCAHPLLFGRKFYPVYPHMASCLEYDVTKGEEIMFLAPGQHRSPWVVRYGVVNSTFPPGRQFHVGLDGGRIGAPPIGKEAYWKMYLLVLEKALVNIWTTDRGISTVRGCELLVQWNAQVLLMEHRWALRLAALSTPP